jgi:hypothetical protein
LAHRSWSKEKIIVHPENTWTPAAKQLKKIWNIWDSKGFIKPPAWFRYFDTKKTPFSLSMLFQRESASLSVSLPRRISTIPTRVSHRFRSVRTILAKYHPQ